MPRKKKLPGKSFILKNKLLTIRYWSQTYTTALFDPKVKDYILTCQYPLTNFNFDILKNPEGGQIYLDIRGDVWIARIKNFEAVMDSKLITLSTQLVNLRLKAAWDMEYSTPSVIYEEILTDKKFFKYEGRNLDNYVKVLGISRKTRETDQALRRRTLEYLSFKLSDQEVLSEQEIRELQKGE